MGNPIAEERLESTAAASSLAHELTLERVVNAPPDKLYRAWTEPDLPQAVVHARAVTVASAELDVRPGGANLIVMQSPEGEMFPNRGVYLEVVPNRRLGAVRRLRRRWIPSHQPS